jgi:hypothetical protein
MRHLDRTRRDIGVQPLQQFARQILTVINAAVVRHELVERHFLLQLRIVRVRVEHDQRESEHVGGGRGAKDAGVLLVEAVGKGLRGVRAAVMKEGGESGL